MCGIFGILALRGSVPSVSLERAALMLEEISRRGPDGSGIWLEENALLAHTRLAVLDPSPRGAQPMATPDGRYRIVYNGELYNDEELRADLLAGGHVPGGFRSACDTETVLFALSAWGKDALQRMRGMFALAFWDRLEGRLLLARDPLGIKPLYYHIGDRELTFASEPKAILAHPGIEVRPNFAMVSAYLTTIRTVLGRNTLFENVLAVCPGEVVEFDAVRSRIRADVFQPAVANEPDGWTEEGAREAVRAAVEDSLERHLRSDVPVCALLSGGLDSSILCALAAAHEQRADRGPIHTWCAGASPSPDFEHAARFAEELGAVHHEVPCDGEDFARDWPNIVSFLGVPLSTPNEVAIQQVSRDLATKGFVVAISGEGADELFGGYGPAIESALRFEADPGDPRSPGRYHLEAASWTPISFKHHLLQEDLWRSLEDDGALVAFYEEEFDLCRREAGAGAHVGEAHLRFQRKNNLSVLLQRLDSATMLSSVEGRTPFADIGVAELAERLPFRIKFGAGTPEDPGASLGKEVLRSAFADELPQGILRRPKASFPLPFQEWLSAQAHHLETSGFSRAIFAEGLRREIRDQPTEYPQLAWPMLNLALWGENWWG